VPPHELRDLGRREAEESSNANRDKAVTRPPRRRPHERRVDSQELSDVLGPPQPVVHPHEITHGGSILVDDNHEVTDVLDASTYFATDRQ
jgi:hypothetical protein